MNLQEIKNMVVVSDLLATAGQPTEEQLRALADDGWEVVINLGLMDARYCLPDEAGLAQANGMQYYHIPVDFGAPAQAQLSAFFAVMDRHAAHKVLVHCAANYRVTCFVALYGCARWDWTRERAEAFIATVWTPDTVWRTFMDGAIVTPASPAASAAMAA